MENTSDTGRTSTREKGKSAESYAEDILSGKGFRIIKRNFRFGRYGEIDLIAEHGDFLVFIEVKSCTTDSYGDPLGFITPSKIKNLRRAAEGYLYINKIYSQNCRFDVVTIDFSKSNPTIRHIENAF